MEDGPRRSGAGHAGLWAGRARGRHACLGQLGRRRIFHEPHRPHRRAQAGLGFVAEDRRLFTGLSVKENLWIAAQAGPVSVGQDTPAQRCERILSLFPQLKAMLHRPASQMSGGEQQMLALARTLMTGPRLLLLDEPCEGIAPVLVASLRDALLQLASEGVAMLVAEQNNILARHAQRVLVRRWPR